MAGLAHGVPVLGLRGSNTDSVLLRHPESIAMTPHGDHDAYSQAAVRLAIDRPRREALGEAGRRLYEASFDWPVVARMVVAAMATFTVSTKTVSCGDRR